MRQMGLVFKGLVLYSRVFYRLRAEGLENIPRQGPCIFASSHHGLLEILTADLIRRRRAPGSLAGFIGRGTLGMGTRWGEGRLVTSLAMQAVGGESAALVFYRARGLSTSELLRALEWLRQGKAILLYPEGKGGASWDGRLKPLNTAGTAWLALRTCAPVVPVISKGVYDIMPRWTAWPRLTGRITIRIGEPFHVSDSPCRRVSDEMIREANQQIWEAMAALL